MPYARGGHPCGRSNKDARTNVANEWMLRYLFINYSRTHSDQSDLRLIAATFEAIGLDPRPFALSILNTSRWEKSGFQPARTWGYYAEHPDVLEEVFNQPKDYHTDSRRENVFAVLAQFPQLPPKWLAMMWELALGARRRTSAGAGVSGQGEGEGAADRRRVVRRQGRHARDRGGVLGRIGVTCRELAISSLKAALKKEKQRSPPAR